MKIIKCIVCLCIITSNYENRITVFQKIKVPASFLTRYNNNSNSDLDWFWPASTALPYELWPVLGRNNWLLVMIYIRLSSKSVQKMQSVHNAANAQLSVICRVNNICCKITVCSDNTFIQGENENIKSRKQYEHTINYQVSVTGIVHLFTVFVYLKHLYSHPSYIKIWVIWPHD